MCAKKTYRSFDDAKKFVQKLGLRSAREWKKYVQSGSKPDDIPSTPSSVYRHEWKGLEDWLGYFARNNPNRQFLPFAEARKFVVKLNLHSEEEWRKYYKSGQKPRNIPAVPENTYRDVWKGYPYWLGTVNEQGCSKFLSFNEARNYVRNLNLKGYAAWKSFCESGKRPFNIPRHPHRAYKDEWKSYSDWTGFNPQRKKFGNLRSYEESKEFIHKLGLKNVKEWNDWKKSGEKPVNIPSTPQLVYEDEWKGMGDWLGTNRIANIHRKYRPYNEAREFVRTLKLKNITEWREWSKSGKRPLDIPGKPHKVYKNEWKDMGDWLGTGRIANQNRVFLPFKDARAFVKSLRIQVEYFHILLIQKEPFGTCQENTL